MKAQELRAKTDEELTGALEASYKELLQLRIQLATKQLANFNNLRATRKDLARIRTILRERVIAGGSDE